jgi:hypothetical protein
MTVTTYMTQYGETVVRLEGGCTEKIVVRFEKRADALALLKALRKRVRR